MECASELVILRDARQRRAHELHVDHARRERVRPMRLRLLLLLLGCPRLRNLLLLAGAPLVAQPQVLERAWLTRGRAARGWCLHDVDNESRPSM